MRTPLLWGGPAALTMLLAGSLAAQNMGPPPIMQVFREEVKAGRAGSHVQTDRKSVV